MLKDFMVIEDGDVGTLSVEEVGDGVVVDVEREVSDHGEEDGDHGWDQGEDEDGEACETCGVRLPGFAMVAHRRFHDLP